MTIGPEVLALISVIIILLGVAASYGRLNQKVDTLRKDLSRIDSSRATDAASQAAQREGNHVRERRAMERLTRVEEKLASMDGKLDNIRERIAKVERV